MSVTFGMEAKKADLRIEDASTKYQCNDNFQFTEGIKTVIFKYKLNSSNF
jgi:hypothetical protein